MENTIAGIRRIERRARREGAARIPPEQERFLPGGAGARALQRGFSFSGVAGAGGVPAPGGGSLCGWFSFRCALLSPRRFALHCGEALPDDASAAVLLTRLAREALVEALRQGAALPPAQLWAACRRTLEESLLELGWQLTAYRPGHLARGEAAPA